MHSKQQHIVPSDFDPPQQLRVGDLVDPKHAAEILGTNERTLANWRALKKGPEFVRIGQRMIRYRVSALQDFIAGGSGKAAA